MCLCFHGPGQGASLHLHGLLFRPDWEVRVKAVLDHAETEPRFDMRRAVLIGLSFGGFLALRAAFFEKRLYQPVDLALHASVGRSFRERS
ncbi:MAG: S9 family peptidase [Myxococcales bacterium]|nr:S9 family peptidase [Myxococcales bacterium]